RTRSGPYSRAEFGTPGASRIAVWNPPSLPRQLRSAVPPSEHDRNRLRTHRRTDGAHAETGASARFTGCFAGRASTPWYSNTAAAGTARSACSSEAATRTLAENYVDIA